MRTRIKRAAEIIKKGGVVIFPTETVYGIGADAFNDAAVKKIFRIKGRPENNPLTVHISKLSDVHKIAKKVPRKAIALMKKYWPGPLTVVLPKKKGVPDTVTAGRKSVGIRMPDHPVALSLIEQSGTLIAAPSANISGEKSPSSVKEIPDRIKKGADAVLDAGESRIGIHSTVIDFTKSPARILRKGALNLS
jgi:L-threonylcarbamoyladenylate synthase